MDQTVSISPYYCDVQDLPGPLPTLDEIETAEIILPCIWPPSNKRIVVVRGMFVVKYGIPRLVDGNEGDALKTLEAIPTIPKLYAMYTHQGKNYLVMQLLPGTPLNVLWRDMSEHEKDTVTQQLHSTFARVRSIPSPSPPIFGSVAGGPVPHRFFMTRGNDPVISGPFADEAAFHNAMALRLRQDQIDDSMPHLTSDFLARHLASAMGRHACVFTHGDLQLKNILVLEDHAGNDGSVSQPRQLVVSGVVDWEGAGWMPSYWEYASMFMYANWADDWTVKFEGIVDAWPSEAAMLMFVRRGFDGF
ncbi:kinase-like domain-containing protein [Xylariaceae sp. FL0804]|nr:kinase-like domain-containing protein [Xylariaceae sp. FL0804]